MGGVVQFQSVKADHCTLLGVLRGVRFDFGFRTTFHKIRMRIGEVVHKIAQIYEKLIYGRSCAIVKNQSRSLHSIQCSKKCNVRFLVSHYVSQGKYAKGAKLCVKLHKSVRSSSMEGVEQFQSIKGDHCTPFSVLRSMAFDFRFHTTFDEVRMRIGEVVRKIAQKCQQVIY